MWCCFTRNFRLWKNYFNLALMSVHKARLPNTKLGWRVFNWAKVRTPGSGNLKCQDPSTMGWFIQSSMAVQPFVWPLLQFRNLLTEWVEFLGRWISPSQGRYLHIEQHKHRINKQTFMPWVGFETTIPTFEQAKTVHALDLTAAVIGVMEWYVANL
jgi:hypothetical protein